MRLLMTCQILLLAMLIGCTSTTPYRNGGVQAGDPASTQPSSCRNSVENIDQTRQIAYVELTDQGLFHDRAQFKAALDLLKSRGEKALNIVLYIHGWKHSAACNDENVASFQDKALRILAEETGDRTVGIYVGWRGAVLDLPHTLQNITFYDRKGAADHVARGSIRELISRLRFICRAADKDLSTPASRKVRLILVGHSFGGLILYNSIAELLFDSVISEDHPLVADFVLLLNPAFEASRFEPLFQAAKDPVSVSGDKPVPFSKMTRPILISMTSEADLATGIAFPLGRSINTLLQHEGWVSEDEGYTQNYADRIEKVANTHTMGHIERYRTHYLDIQNKEVICKEFKNSLIKNTTAFPLWNVYTSAQVMSDHDDIFNEKLWRFVKKISEPGADLFAICQY